MTSEPAFSSMPPAPLISRNHLEGQATSGWGSGLDQSLQSQCQGKEDKSADDSGCYDPSRQQSPSSLESETMC